MDYCQIHVQVIFPISDPSRSIFTCHVTPSVPRTRPKKEGPPAHILPRRCVLCSLFLFLSCSSPQIHQFHRILSNRYRPQPPNHWDPLPKPRFQLAKPRSRIPTAFPDWKNLTTSLHTSFRFFSCGYALSRPRPTLPQGQSLLNSKLDSSKNSCPIT